MKILVSVLSKKDNGVYSNLENVIRNTWLKNKPDNIDVIFYYGDSKNNELIGDKLSLNIVDTYQNISHKTLLMYNYLYENSNKYDYIFRTNLSSYLDLDLLNEFIKDKPLNKFYCGIIGQYGEVKFASGSGYFISKDILEFIYKNKDRWDINVIDDVALGKLLSKEFKIDTNAKRQDIKNVNEHITKTYHYRCKQKDRNDDIKILNKIYNNGKNN